MAILDVQRLHQLSDEQVTLVVLRGHWQVKATGHEVRATACNIFRLQQDANGERIQSYTVVNNTAAFALALNS